MTSSSRTLTDRSRTVRTLVALLCLLLVLVASTASVMHTHPTGTSDASCSLCAVAHLSAIPVPHAATAIAEPSEAFLPPSHTLAARASAFHFSLYVRPPPSLTPRA